MARRYCQNMSGERYLENTLKLEVHDLDNEKTNCRIDEIIRNGYDWPLLLLETAHKKGLANCPWCIGESER